MVRLTTSYVGRVLLVNELATVWVRVLLALCSWGQLLLFSWLSPLACHFCQLLLCFSWNMSGECRFSLGVEHVHRVSFLLAWLIRVLFFFK